MLSKIQCVIIKLIFLRTHLLASHYLLACYTTLFLCAQMAAAGPAPGRHVRQTVHKCKSLLFFATSEIQPNV